MKRGRLRIAILRRLGLKRGGSSIRNRQRKGRNDMYKKSQKCSGVMKRSLILSGNITTPLRCVLEPARLFLGHAEDVHILSHDVEQWPWKYHGDASGFELRTADG